jgi:15-cis-phytoene synthase
MSAVLPYTAAPLDTGPDMQACKELMRGGSKSFFAASRVLPARVRGPAVALYAFCRVADDAIDNSTNPAHSMAHLQERLQRIYAGQPMMFDADRALADVVARFGIPRALLEALLEGFAWDASGRRYNTIEDLHAYGARVAGTVGAMMAVIMQTRSPAAVARACELGVAMQFTNIARDVGEDARNGRLYLPRQWLQEAGVEPEAWLRRPVFNTAIASVVSRLLAEADALYRRAEHGVAELPRDCRPAIQAARLVYADIGREVARAGHDSVTRRAVVSGERKLALMARAMSAALLVPAAVDPKLAPLPAVQFLVDAAAVAPRPALASGSFYDRTLWVIDLFERVAERDRAARCGGA